MLTLGNWRKTLEAICILIAALLFSLVLFGFFCFAAGANPFEVYSAIYQAAFGSWSSFQNSLIRAAPLMLTSLCTALPARLGLVVIGNLPTLETQNFPPLLEVREMTKRFGAFTALDHVSMTLKPGTFHTLLGENGAGKSTLVKCIMGFYTPTSGKVQLDGQDCTIASPRDAQKYGIGMVYQHFTSVPAMTVAENLVIARSGGDLVVKANGARRSPSRKCRTITRFQCLKSAIFMP